MGLALAPLLPETYSVPPEIGEGLKIYYLAVAKPVNGHRSPGQAVRGLPDLGSLEIAYISGNIIFRCILAYGADIELVPEREQIS